MPRIHAWWVAPTYSLCRDVWRRLKKAIPEEMVVSTNESQLSITLVDDILIEMKTGEHGDRLRSVGLDVLVIDEAALIEEDVWDTSLRPRLASPGRTGIAMILSTPKGRGWFFRAYQNGLDPDQPDWESVHASTADNPAISAAEISALRSAMTERSFRQEILAEFLDSSGGVFSDVRAYVVGRRPLVGNVVVGIDWGRRHDYTALCALDSTGLVVGFERFNGLSWEGILAKTIAFVESFPSTTLCVPEANGIGDVLCENLKARLPRSIRCEPYLMTNSTKRQAIERLALSLEQGRIFYPDIPTLINELEIYEFSESATGVTRFSAPSGAHDDGVISLALAHAGSVVLARFASEAGYAEYVPRSGSRGGPPDDVKVGDSYIDQRSGARVTVGAVGKVEPPSWRSLYGPPLTRPGNA